MGCSTIHFVSCVRNSSSGWIMKGLYLEYSFYRRPNAKDVYAKRIEPFWEAEAKRVKEEKEKVMSCR